MTILFVLLLCAAAMLTLVIGASSSSDHKSDAAGQGMATAFAFFEAILLAVLLAVLLLISGLNGGLRGVSGLLAPVLYVSAVSALFIALRILEKAQPEDRFQFLLRLVLMACPALLILYSAWSFFPAAREHVPSMGANLGIGLPLVLLSLAVWTVRGPSNATSSAREQAQRQAFADARQRDEALVTEIRALPDTSPLADLLSYAELPSNHNANSGIDVRGAALARASKLPHRQAEAETLLHSGATRVLRNLAGLDLQMTPRLCEGARTSLRRAAEELKPAASATVFEDTILDPYTINIRWLLENKCDCKNEVEALEQTILLYPESFARKRAIDYLDYLLGKANPYGTK